MTPSDAGDDARGYQLRYSEVQPVVSDEASRRRKARKILAILRDALGDRDPAQLRLLDVGGSTGYVADELATAFGEVILVDIDEPALERARAVLQRPNAKVLQADAMALPFAAEEFDVVVANHVYEHVPSARRLVAEIRRVLRHDGIVYFSACNRLSVIEPHYRLPFLSWLPPRLADSYLRLTGRGSHYYERMLTRRGLGRLLAGFRARDYTLRILREPSRFEADDVPMIGLLRHVPAPMLRLALPLVPIYLLVLRKRDA